MFEFLPESQDNILGIKMIGKLTDDDYQKVLIPKMKQLMKAHEKLKVLLQFEDFDGWELKAGWDDAVFGIAHRKDFKKLALVGGPAYVEWSMNLFAPFMTGEIRHFPAQGLTAAWAWIRE